MSAENVGKITPGIADAPTDAITAADKIALITAVTATFDTLLTWNYTPGEHTPIEALYKKAKASQWDSDLDIDWSVGHQIDRARDPSNKLNLVTTIDEDVFAKLNAAQRADLGHACTAWTISQFLHAEQGALACAAKIVQAAPWIDTKFVASTQVMDEARHTEVYARYLREKLEWEFPVNAHLGALLRDIIEEPRWDFTFLGMQVVIEGLALAAFGFQYQLTPDPLLRQITRYIIADEARHVAFGVMSLRDVYAEMTAAELRERQEFCFESAVRMRNRFLAEDLWEALDLPVAECATAMKRSRAQIEFRQTLFSKFVPNVKKLGLLDFGDKWLRDKFGELGVLGFENLPDAVVEYPQMDLEHAPWAIVQFQHY